LFQVRLFLFGWLGHFPQTGKPVSLAQTQWELDLQKKEKAMFRNFKVLLIVLVVIAIAGSAYAFAAANTVPDSAAGYKANTVPGYTVTGIVYDLNSTDPTKVENIKFSISPTTGTVVAAIVKIQTAATGWKDCDLTAGTAPAMNVVCAYTTPFLALDSVVALNIVASSSTDPAAQ
jgi:hypothetical protein